MDIFDLRPYQRYVSRTTVRTRGLIHKEVPGWHISLLKAVILKKETLFFVDIIAQFPSVPQASKVNHRLNFTSEPQKAAEGSLKEGSESRSRTSGPLCVWHYTRAD